MHHVHRLLFVSLVAVAACNGDPVKLYDAGTTDANGYDSMVVDTTPPDTSITAQPPALGNSATAHFEFASTEPDSTFTCVIDGGTPQPCGASFDTTVAEGAHTLSVAATDKAGNVDPTPATASWTVDLTPPDTTITKNPPAIDNSVDVEFDFTATETPASFECQVDGAAFVACTTPDLLTALAAGDHTFAVRATDAAGNVDPTPATWSWTIDTTTPDTVIDSGPTGSIQQTDATFTFHSPNAGAGATFKCGLDGAALAACTSPKSYAGLAEGAHTFTVQVTNAAGTSDPTPATQTWTVDHTAPTVAIDPPTPANPTNATTATFTFHSPSDAGATFTCAIDGGAFGACTSTTTYNGLTGGAGTSHTFQVEAHDAAGNTSAPASFTWKIDTQAPTTLITFASPGTLSNNNGARFEFTASEAPATFACSLDGGAFVACTTGQTYNLLADGPHTFAVRATDLAGNTGAPATWSWTIDTVGATVVIDAPTPSDPTNQTSATFMFHSPSDANATYECALDGGAFATCNPGQTFTGLTGGAGTSHTFKVHAIDAVGNTGGPATFTWTIDTQAPTIAIDPPTPANPTNATTAAFTFHSPSDATATYQCHLDSASYTACSPGKTYTGISGGAGTSHSFHVRAIDTAGNVGTGTSFTWTVDTSAPTVTLDSTPASLTNATSATFAFHSADGGTSYECALDGGAFAACTSSKAYSGLTGGSGTQHTFQVRATDDAGNVGAPTSYTWTIDTQGPTVTIDTTPANPTASTTGTFTFHSPDGGTSYQCSIDGGAFASCASGKSYTGLAGGAGTQHTFQVKATDGAGNTGSASQYQWTIDTQGATVAIDTTPANPTSSTTGAFTFHSPSDGASATFECSIDGGAFASCASGKSYTGLAGGAGTQHTFQVRATDALGNTGATAQYQWTIDTQGATVAIDSTPANPTNSTTGTFTFHSPSDAGATFECQMDGGGFSACSSGKSYTGLTGGAGTQHTFQVRASDALGNTGATAQYQWTIDTQGPTVTIDTAPANPTTSTTGTFTFHSPDGGTSYLCSIDGGAFASCASGKSYTGLAGGAGTQHTFQVKATDAATNTGNASQYQWTIDTQGATVAIDSTPANPTSSTTGTFTFHSPSDGANATFECSIDGGAFASCSSGKSYTGLTGGVGTQHTFQVRASDALGTTGAAAQYQWTIDTSAPTVTLDAPLPANPTNATAAAFAFHSADGGTSFQCQMDGGGFSSCSSGKMYTSLTGGPAQTGVSHTFQVKATDNATNTGAATSFVWTVDTVAPHTSLGSNPVNPSASSSASFTFTADEASTYTCQLDANAPFACNTGATSFSSLSNASHTFTVYATDTAGNADASPSSFTWVVNTNPPTLTQVPPSGWTVNYFPFAWTGPLSGVNYECSIDGGTSWFGCTAPYEVKGANYGVANPFAVRWVDAANAHSPSAGTSWTPNQGLVLYYPLDSDLKNRSVLAPYYSHDGSGPVSFVGGYAAGALQPLGPVSLKNTIQPLTSGSAYTISFWVEAFQDTDAATGYAQGDVINTFDPKGFGGCRITYGQRGTSVVQCGGSPQGALAPANAGSTVGQWSNVILRYAGTGANVEVYLNGTPLVNSTVPNPNKEDVFSASQLANMILGGTPVDATTALMPIDDLRVYNTAFTPQVQCQTLVNGTWDPSKNNCAATRPGVSLNLDMIDGTATTRNVSRNTGFWSLTSSVDSNANWVIGAFGQSFQFNVSTVDFTGVQSYMPFPKDDTISFWFYDDGTFGQGANTLFDFSCPMGFGGNNCPLDATGKPIPGGLFAQSNKGALRVCANIASGAQICAVDSAPAGAWHHVMLTSTGTLNGQGQIVTQAIYVWIDGAQVDKLSINGAGDAFANVSNVLLVGDPALVAIDEFKIWPYDLSTFPPEWFCRLGKGGAYDATNGTCTLPKPSRPY